MRGSASERRARPRHSVDIATLVRSTSGAELFRGTIQNLSLGGALFHTADTSAAQELVVPATVGLELELPRSAGPKAFACKGVILWANESAPAEMLAGTWCGLKLEFETAQSTVLQQYFTTL